MVKASGASRSVKSNLGFATKWVVVPFQVAKISWLGLLFLVLPLTAMALSFASFTSKELLGHLSKAKLDNPTLADFLANLARIVPWLLIVPFLIAIMVLPVRTIWFDDTKVLSRLLDELATAVSRAFTTCWLTLRVLLLHLVPGFALVGIYFVLIRKHGEGDSFLVFLGAGALVLALVLYRQAPNFFAPIISVCAFYDPMESIGNSPVILKSSILSLCTSFLCGVAASVGLHVSLHGYSFVPKRIEWWELGVHAFILWYTLTILAFIVMLRLCEYEQIDLSAPPPAPPQSPEEPDRVPFPS